jgi:hypothetical protein
VGSPDAYPPSEHNDDFGRATRDGGLTFGYDANGNRASIVYPGEVTATYEFDFADRETSLRSRPPPTTCL